MPLTEPFALERHKNRERAPLPMTFRSNSGNTLGEYVAIATLVALCCIAAFLAVGNNMGDLLSGLKQDMGHTVSSAKQQVAYQQLKKDEFSVMAANPALSSWKPIAGQVGATAATFSGNPQATTNTITTLGANGATEQLADQIAQLAADWLASGKITQAQADVLIRLANQGHQLADNERLFSEALLGGQPDMVVNGQSYPLANGLGYTTMQDPDVLNLNPQQANPLLRPFAETYHEFLGQAQLDPALKQQISNLAIQISAVDDGLKWSGEDALAGHAAQNRLTEEELWAATAVHFNDNISNAPSSISSSGTGNVRTLTNTNSTQVCVDGQGEDDGETCTP